MGSTVPSRYNSGGGSVQETPSRLLGNELGLLRSSRFFGVVKFISCDQMDQTDEILRDFASDIIAAWQEGESKYPKLQTTLVEETAKKLNNMFEIAKCSERPESQIAFHHRIMHECYISKD